MTDPRKRLLVALLASGLAAAGCAKRSDELLVVYSGDCQGYLDPCG
jgi:hypothetical protein